MKKLFAVLLFFSFLFLTGCTTTVDRQHSPDGRYTVVLQECTEMTPGNNLGGKILLQLDGETVQSEEESFWYGPWTDDE